MKDSLFDILFTFFEKRLAHLKQDKTLEARDASEHNTAPNEVTLREPGCNAMRIFIEPELARFSKASYQFLVRMLRAKIIHPALMEQIIHSLVASDSRYVSLEETKWTMRNKLSTHLSTKDLAFLDLILYQKEEGFSVH